MKTLEIILLFIGIIILVIVLGYIIISIQRLSMMQQNLSTKRTNRSDILVTPGYYDYYNPFWNWGWDNWGWGGRKHYNDNHTYNYNYNYNKQTKPSVKPTLPPTPSVMVTLPPTPSVIVTSPPTPSVIVTLPPTPSPVPSVQEVSSPPEPSTQSSPMTDIIEGFTATTVPNLNQQLQANVSSPQGFFRNALSTEDADMIQVYKSMNQGTTHQKEVLASAAIGYRMPDLERAAPLPTLPVNGPNTNIYPPWGLVN
jgi:hypothetical protein